MKRDYAKIVAEAEARVGQIKDPLMRRVTFEKVLDIMLKAKAFKGAAKLEPRK